MQLVRGGVEVLGHRGAMAGGVELEEAAGGMHGVSPSAADDGIPAGAAGGGEEALASAEQRGIAAAEEDLVRAAGSAGEGEVAAAIDRGAGLVNDRIPAEADRGPIAGRRVAELEEARDIDERQ